MSGTSFRIAAAQPELIASITVAPGFPQSDSDQQALAELVEIPVSLFVGSNGNELWITSGQETEEQLSDLGGNVTLSIEEGQGHIHGLACHCQPQICQPQSWPEQR